MKIHTFTIQHINGEIFKRCEWGKNKKQAMNTIYGIYGKENIVAMVAI